MWGNLHGGIAANGPGLVDSTPRLFGVLALAVVIAFVALKVSRRWSDASFYRIIFRNYDGQSDFTIPADDPTWLDRTARMYDLKRKKNESDEAVDYECEAA